MKYKAFISYSHGTDGKLAPELERGLKRFAKPWYRLRAMRVFRDQTGLALTPELWPKIVEALDQSEFFIIMASPEAAGSRWVRKEIEHWLTHRDPLHVFIVLTDGDLVWDTAANDFDWQKTTALPDSFKGRFANEPLHLDLRWARQAENLSLRENRFRNSIVELAAPLHGRDKDEIAGEDVRQHRRTVQIVAATCVVLAGLTVWATLQAIIAEQRRQTAESRQIAAQALSRLDRGELDTSLLLSLEASRVEATQEARASLLEGLITYPHLVRYVYGHETEIKSVVFSPDGTYFASGSDDGTILRWNSNSGQALGAAIQTEGNILTSLAFSPDGQILAAGHQDGSVHFTMADQSTTPIETVQACEVVWAITFVGDGNDMAAACRYEGVTSWSIDAPTVRRLDIPGDWDTIRPAAFSADGAVVAASGISSVFAVDVAQQPTSSPDVFANQGRDVLAVDGSGRLVAVAQGSTIELWDRETKDRLRDVEGPPGETISALAFNSDGNLLAAGTAEGTVIVRSTDKRRGKRLFLHGHRGRVSALAFSPHADAFVSGDASGLLVQWNLNQPYRIMQRVDATVAEDSTPAIGPNGNTITWLDEDSALQQWRLNESTLDAPMTFEDLGPIRHFSYQPGGRLLALALEEGYLQLWDLEKNIAHGERINAYEEDVTSLVFHPDGETVAAFGCAKFAEIKGRGRIHRYCGQEVVRTFSVNENIAFQEEHAANRHSLFSHATRGDGSFEEIIKSLDVESIQNSTRAVHPDGVTLITAGCGAFDSRCTTGVIQFWDIPSRRRDGPQLRAHGTGIRHVALSPDGQFLASGDDGGAIIIWDVRTREPIGPPMRGHERRISHLAFNSDGSLLVSADQDAIIVWDLRPEALADHACDIANRQFTEAEWRMRFDDDYRATCP